MLVGVLSFFSTDNLSAQYVKRTLIEQHTGAWCGWCPDGTVVMDQILAKYPNDKVIGIKVHNGDQMTLPEQAEIASALGLTGYPTGNVNRQVFTINSANTIFMDRGAWMSATDAVVNAAVEAGVNLSYSFDPATREVIATVRTEFVKEVTGEVRMNALVVEDNVSGSGTGWDQANYFSNNSSYTSHPYYSKPNPIQGYKHMKVVRAFLGGAWGTPGSCGAATVGKKYVYSYKYTLPAAVKTDDMYMIGLAQKYNDNAGGRNVLNVIRGTKVDPTITWTVSGAPIQVKKNGETGMITITIKNLTATDAVFNWTLTKSPRTPNDWTAATTAPTDVTVPANGTVDVPLSLTAGPTQGFGDANIILVDKNNPNGLAVSEKVTVASEEIEYFHVVDDGAGGQYALTTALKQAGYNNFFDVSASDFNSVASALPNVKCLVWSAGEAGSMTAAAGTAITSLIDKGCKVLLTGAILSVTANTSAKGLLAKLGIQYLKPCYQGYSDAIVNIKGYSGDPITNGFAQSGQLIQYLTFALKILNTTTTTPILRHTAVDTIIATKTDLGAGKARVVFLAINPSVITNATARQDLIKKSMDWLNGASANVGPQIEADVSSLNFDIVKMGSDLDMNVVLKNSGDKDLTITGWNFDKDFDPDGVFTIKSGSSLNPVVMKAGTTRTLVINFKPTAAKKYTGSLTIVSDSKIDNNLMISMDGTGQASGNAPRIASTKSILDFSEVLIGKSLVKDFDISNEGTADLNITKISIEGDDDNVFSFVDGNTPATIKPGSSITVTLKFSPKSGKVYNTAKVAFESDAVNGKYYVNLLGQGPLSVPTEAVSPDGLITIKATPNPVNNIGLIQYTLNTQNASMLQMILVDLNGKTVMNLLNESVDAGTNSLQLNAETLNSGTYYIIANINGSSAKLPIVIVK